MTREGDNGVLGVFTRCLLTIPTIFRAEDLFVLNLVVINVRPSGVATLVQLIHGFGRKFVALVLGIHIREQFMELVPPVHHDEQRVGALVPVQSHDIPAGR